jgi:hypothetical protein
MKSNLKISQKFPLSLNKKQWTDSKNLEGGKQRSKKESISMKHQNKIPKAT